MSAHPSIHPEPVDEGRGRPRDRSLLAVGAILIVLGLLAVVARVADIELGAFIGEQTWPFLVIVPGLVLLAMAFVRTPPAGLGFVIAGSIVTTVGTILLVQANTGAWASWAYVWALIPAAAGLGMALYGLLGRTRELVDTGVRMVLIGGALFAVGWWYFETLFSTGKQPIDLGGWWPLVLIGIGVVLTVRALLDTRAAGGHDRTQTRGTI